jgi:hypothetical protein
MGTALGHHGRVGLGKGPVGLTSHPVDNGSEECVTTVAARGHKPAREEADTSRRFGV